MRKIIINLILFVFYFSLTSYSQEIDTVKVVKIGEDTSIVITPNQLKTINTIILDREHAYRLLTIKQSIINLNNEMLSSKDSIILENNNIMKKQETYYKEQFNYLSEMIEQEKKKKKLAIGGVTIAALTVIILTVL